MDLSIASNSGRLVLYMCVHDLCTPEEYTVECTLKNVPNIHTIHHPNEIFVHRGCY